MINSTDPKNQPVLGQPIPRLDLDLESAPSAPSLSMKDRDYGVPNIGTDTQYLKGQMQSGWQQAGRATVGVLTGALGAAENLTYLTDIFSGVEGAVENEVAQYLREKKKELGEEFEIYKSEEGIGLSDSATYFEGLKAILDSATAFGISGGVIAKGAGLAGKALHGARVARLLQLTEPRVNMATTWASGALNNYIEGTTMAVSLYEDIESQMSEKYPNMSKTEIKEIAAEKATNFRRANAFLMGADVIELNGLANAFNATRAFEKRNFAKDMFVKQSAPEFLQESIQSVGEGVSLQSAVEQRDIDLDLIKANALKAETLYEGVIGAVAGPLQFGAMNLVSKLDRKGTKEKEERYQKSLSVFEEMGKLVEESVQGTKQFEEALKNNKVSEKDLNTFAQSHVSILAMKAFTTGTANEFERQLDSMIEGEQDSAKKEYLKGFKKQFSSLEKEYINATVYNNSAQVFKNRANNHLQNFQKKALEEKAEEVSKELSKAFTSYGISGYELILNKETGEFEVYVKDTDTKVEVNKKGKKPTSAKKPVKSKFTKQAAKKAEEQEQQKVTIEEELNSKEDFALSKQKESELLETFYRENEALFIRAAKIAKELNAVKSNIDNLDKRYKYLISDEGQKEAIKDREEAIKKAKIASERENQKASQTADAKEINLSTPPKKEEENSTSDILDDAKAAGIDTEVNAVPPIPVIEGEGASVSKIDTSVPPVNPVNPSGEGASVDEGMPDGEGASVSKLNINTTPTPPAKIQPIVIKEKGEITELTSESQIDSVIFSIANFSVAYELVDTQDPTVKVLVDRQGSPTNDYRLDKKNLKNGTVLTLKHNVEKDTVEIYTINGKGNEILIGSLHNKEFVKKYYEIHPDVSSYTEQKLEELQEIIDYVKVVGKVNVPISIDNSNKRAEGIVVTDNNGKYFINNKAGFFKTLTKSITKDGVEIYILDGKVTTKKEILNIIESTGASKRQALEYLSGLGSGIVVYLGEDGTTHEYGSATIAEIEASGDKSLSQLLDKMMEMYFSPTRTFKPSEFNYLLTLLFPTASKITDEDKHTVLNVDFRSGAIKIKLNGEIITMSLRGDYFAIADQIKAVLRTNQTNKHSDAEIAAMFKKFGIEEASTEDAVKKLRTSGLTSNQLIKSYTDINGVEKRSSTVNPLITFAHSDLVKNALAYKEQIRLQKEAARKAQEEQSSLEKERKEILKTISTFSSKTEKPLMEMSVSELRAIKAKLEERIAEDSKEKVELVTDPGLRELKKVDFDGSDSENPSVMNFSLTDNNEMFISPSYPRIAMILEQPDDFLKYAFKGSVGRKDKGIVITRLPIVINGRVVTMGEYTGTEKEGLFYAKKSASLDTGTKGARVNDSRIVDALITFKLKEFKEQSKPKQAASSVVEPVIPVKPVVESKGEYSSKVYNPLDEEEDFALSVEDAVEGTSEEEKLSDISIEGVSEGTLLSLVKAVSKKIVDSAKTEQQRKKDKLKTEEQKAEERREDIATVNSKLESFFKQYVALYTDLAINSATEKEKEHYSAVLNELLAAKNNIGIVKMRLKAYLNYIKSGNEFTEDIDNENSEQIEKNNDDDFLFKFDPRMSASNRLKSSFLFIREYKKLNEPSSGLFGEVYVDPNMIWFKLRDVFSVLDSASTIEDYIEILRKSVSTHPEFSDVIELLEKADESYTNEFISQCNVHENVMTSISFNVKTVKEKDMPDQEIYYINVSKTNDFDRARALISSWKSSFRRKGLYYTGEDGVEQFNTEKYNDFKEKINKYKTTNKNARELTVKELFTLLNEDLGLTFPKSFVDMALNLNAKEPKSIYFLRRRVFNASTVLDIINKNLIVHLAKNPSEVSEQYVYGMAIYMSKFDSSIRTRNQRVGDKIFSGYILPNSITNKAKRFKRNSKEELGLSHEDILKQIKRYINDPFSQDSLWLEMLYGDLMGKEKGLYSEELKNDFNVNFLSENPLKKGGSKVKKATELGKISNTDLFFTKLSLFFANYNINFQSIDTGISTFVSPTIADVKSLYTATTKAINLTKNNTKTGLEVLTDKQYEYLIRSLFVSELKRAIAYEDAQVKPDIAGLDKNSFRFFFVNAFNDLKYNGQPVMDENTGKVHEALKYIIKNGREDLLSTPNDNIKLTAFVNDLKRTILENIEAETEKTTKFILENGLDKDQKLVNIANNPNQVFNFVANYMISNSEWYKLFLGDPALYGNKNDVTINATLNDIGKRTKGQHSPGLSVPYRSNIDNRYNVLVFEDIIIDGAVSTDSEEYLTINEHVENLYHRGLISSEQYDKYKEIRINYINDLRLLLSELTGLNETDFASNEEYFIALSKKLTPEIIEEARNPSHTFDISSLEIEEINPLKPVQHGDIYTEENNPDMSKVTKGLFFCKSSTKVLISSFTAQNKTLDNLRVSLDILEASKVKKFTPDRLAAKSGVKLGKPVAVKRNGFKKPGYTSIEQNPIDLIKEITGQEAYSPSLVTLNRDVLKYQQDFVNKEKKKITPTSQGRSMFALDMAFAVKDKKAYEQLWTDLYKSRYTALTRRFSTNGKVDYAKIKKLLIEHAEKLNYTKAEIDFIRAGGDKDFILPLLSNPNYKRFQYLFTSLFTKGVISDGISGDSQVLLSSAGLDGGNTTFFGEQTFVDIKDSIVYAEGWDGNLQDEREGADGKTLGAQVLVPLAFHYRDANGERVKLKLSDITRVTEDGKKVIDTSKLPEGALKSFGFRIPYQGHGSSAMLEIVGFLPEGVNGIIAPATFVAKMGGDYDFDKLNIYTYNLQQNEDGSFGYSKDETDALENKIIDSHINIRSSWKQLKEVEKAIKYGNIYNEDKPDDEESIFGLISKLRQGTKADKSIAFESYQNNKYHNAKGAKSAIGIYANYLVLLGYMQGKETEFSSDYSFSIGKADHNKLSDLKVVGKDKYKSEVLAAYLSLSIDNEKLQAAGLLNINDFTINATAAAAFLGYDEDILYLLNQKSVIDIVEKAMLGVNTISSDKEKTVRDAEKEVIQSLYKQIYDIAPEKVKKEEKRQYGKMVTAYSLIGGVENKYSLEDYKNNLLDNNVSVGDSAIIEKILMQIKAVELFSELNSLGEKFQSLSSVLNTDSKGTPKTFLELLEKKEKIEKIKTKTYRPENDPYYPLQNYKEMFYEGVKASANLYGVEFAFQAINQIFDLKPLLTSIDLIKLYVGSGFKYSSTEKFDLNNVLYKDFVSHLYANTVPNAREERKRLLIDDAKTGNQSITTTIQKLHNTPAYRKLLRDFPILNYIKTSEHSNFNVNFLENTENDQFTDDYIIKYASFNSLYDANVLIKDIVPGKEYTTRDLYKDLVQYCLVCTGVQGSNDFFKYVNPKYLVDNGIGESLQKTLASLKGPTIKHLNFIEEFVLHNPEILSKVAWTAVNGVYTVKLEDLERLGYDGENNSPKYVKDNNDNVYKIDYNNMSSTSVKMTRLSRFEVYGINEYNNDKQPSLFQKKTKNGVNQIAERKAEIAASKKEKQVVVVPHSLSTGANKDSIISYLKVLLMNPDTTKEQLIAVNFILHNIELLPSGVNVIIDNTVNFDGKAAGNTITLKTGTDTSVNLEEIIHLVTKEAVMSENVSEQTKELRAKLSAVHQQIIERLKKQDPSFANKLKQVQTKVEAVRQRRTDINTKLTPEEYNIYKLYNLQEFTAAILLDKEFNEFVFGKESKLSETEKKSILYTIAEFLKSLLTDLGIDYTNEEHISALNTVVELVDSVKKNLTAEEKIQLDLFTAADLSPIIGTELDSPVVVNDIKFTDITELGKYIKSICL